MLAIRAAAHAEDLEQFRRLEREYDAELPPELRHDAHEKLDEALVAWNGSEAAGCVAMCVVDERTAIMKRLYVRPAQRGSGAGRALAQACVDLARERGLTRIVLDTDKEHLKAAYRLYRSMGFRECDSHSAVEYRCPTYMELVLG